MDGKHLRMKYPNPCHPLPFPAMPGPIRDLTVSVTAKVGRVTIGIALISTCNNCFAKVLQACDRHGTGSRRFVGIRSYTTATVVAPETCVRSRDIEQHLHILSP